MEERKQDRREKIKGWNRENKRMEEKKEGWKRKKKNRREKEKAK